MSTFDCILFPTDGSKQSKRTLESLIELAKQFKSKVFVLNTFEVPVPITNYEFSSDLYLSVEAVLSKNSKDVLDEVKESLEKEGIYAKYISLAGDSSSIIIEKAKELEITMILMGSRGLGTIKSLMMGSVSNYVLHHSNCPVMIIH